MRRIKELAAMNEDIENNSLIGNTNFKDCRPIDNANSSIFSNSTIAESQNKSSRVPKGS